MMSFRPSSKSLLALSSRSRVWLWCLAALADSAVAHADLAEDCSALGQAMVEHSCFHSTFGPFVSVAGTPGVEPNTNTPNLDAVHTEYRVGLALQDQQHVVTYSPQRSGSWSVFTSYDVPLQVVDEEGEPLDFIFEQRGDTGCDALPIARVYSLEAMGPVTPEMAKPKPKRYTLRFGPTDEGAAIVVIEYADDFLVSVGRDADGDGHGSAADAFVSNCVPPEGYAPNTSDCDDDNAAIHPGAEEHCDDVDENCNGSPDDVGLQCRAGAGVCVVVGEFTCDEDVATCDAIPLEPEQETCNGKDDDCDGVIDDGGDELCTEKDQPRCVRLDFSAFCGCLLDADCGALDSGRLCDGETNTCHDGCSLQEGRNTCPSGQHCEAEGGAGTGVCVDETPAPKPDPQANLRGVDESDSAKGCSCRAAGSSPKGLSPFGLSALFASLWLLRRRPRGERGGLAAR